MSDGETDAAGLWSIQECGEKISDDAFYRDYDFF